MNNYILDEAKYYVIIKSKLDNYYEQSTNKFKLQNPDFVFNKTLTVEEETTLKLLQTNQIDQSQVSEEMFKKFEEFFNEAKSVEDKIISGELNSALYTKEELAEMFKLTEQDLEKIIIEYGKEE